MYKIRLATITSYGKVEQNVMPKAITCIRKGIAEITVHTSIIGL